MPPLIPYHVSAGSNPIVKFGGALITEFLEPPPGRCFCFRQKYCLKPPMDENDPDFDKINDALNHPSGPPLHFHPFQNEYFRVEQGRMCVEIDGVLHTLTPEDGEIMGRAGSVHRFYIAPDSTEDMIIILSASDSGLVHEGKMDLIQLLCTYDAGDAYLLPPAWLPNSVRKFIGYWGGVIVGRWIGRLLGYKPFFKEYTTDWAYAVHKMEASSFTRQVVGRSFTSAMSWAQLQMCAAQWQYGGGTEGLVSPEVKKPRITNGHE